MILFPPCKINLGLKILNKREDGFHNLETCMLQLPFHDVLEANKSTDFQFTTSGLSIPGLPEENICVRAYQLMKKQFSIDPVHIHLHKILPMGGGIGGGSADGTYVIKAIQALFDLNITTEKLQNLAAELGSDCPLFVVETPQIATGRGEILRTIDLSLSGHYVKLVNTGLHISTQEAFSNIEYSTDTQAIEHILSQPMDEWKKHLKNDFEKTIFPKHPTLAAIKEKLYHEGACYASMTGSGSTMFGIYAKKPSKTFDKTTIIFEEIIEM